MKQHFYITFRRLVSMSNAILVYMYVTVHTVFDIVVKILSYFKRPDDDLLQTGFLSS
jgi:hypothetical protein